MTTVRMQFDVPYEKVQEIEALIKVCGFETKKDLFNNAITLLKWVVRHSQKGNVIAAVNETQERYTELGMPFIEHIRDISRNNIQSMYAEHS